MHFVTRLIALVLLTVLSCAPAAAHRYCMGIDDEGKPARATPDVNSERPEFRVVEEATFLPSFERKRYVIADGIPFPICSLEECERYKGAMKLDLRGKPSMTVRAFCEEH